jgi:hypothetical protein
MALLLPPGWRRAKEQKKLESERERERELLPKETQESQKRQQNLSYFAQQKRPLSFSHR